MVTSDSAQVEQPKDIPERLAPIADFGWRGEIPQDISDEEIAALLRLRDLLAQRDERLAREEARRGKWQPLHLAYNP